MEIFNYFVNRDMVMVASVMQNSEQQANENTLLQVEEAEIQMQWKHIYQHLLIWISTFLQKHRCFTEITREANLKMYGLNLKLSSQIALTCQSLITWVFRREKFFFALEKRNGNTPKCHALMHTEENAKLNWINRRLVDLNINLPQSFGELEQFKDGHLLEFLNVWVKMLLTRN